MNTLIKKIDSIPWQTVLLLCVSLGLAPFIPPHIVEKIQMLFAGSLVKPIDWFDLFFHGMPWMLFISKVLIHYKKSKSTYVDQN